MSKTNWMEPTTSGRRIQNKDKSTSDKLSSGVRDFKSNNKDTETNLNFRGKSRLSRENKSESSSDGSSSDSDDDSNGEKEDYYDKRKTAPKSSNADTKNSVIPHDKKNESTDQNAPKNNEVAISDSSSKASITNETVSSSQGTDKTKPPKSTPTKDSGDAVATKNNVKKINEEDTMDIDKDKSKGSEKNRKTKNVPLQTQSKTKTQKTKVTNPKELKKNASKPASGKITKKDNSNNNATDDKENKESDEKKKRILSPHKVFYWREPGKTGKRRFTRTRKSNLLVGYFLENLLLEANIFGSSAVAKVHLNDVAKLFIREITRGGVAVMHNQKRKQLKASHIKKATLARGWTVV